MYEVFDHRTPDINVTTTRTELGARFAVAWRLWQDRNKVEPRWLDYAKEGEGWV